MEWYNRLWFEPVSDCIVFFIRWMISEYLWSRINSYSVASTDDAAYFIGGRMGSENEQDIIAQFKEEIWSIFGKLEKPRATHESIRFGNEVMIFGGETNETS